MKRLKFNLLRSLLLALLPLGVMAQNFSGYNWYFGPQGLRFSRSDNTSTLTTGYPTPAGQSSAVANNQVNGDLLFYTDGQNIYDVSNTVMPNGTTLGADPTDGQAVSVGKVPGQDNQYYVFVKDALGNVSYRIVDMAAFGNAAFPAPALGAVTSAANTAIAGLTNRAEAMIVVPHDDGDSFWIITHATGSPDYTVTLVSPAGPLSTTTFPAVGLITDPANFTFNPTTNQIAVAPNEPNRAVEIVNFDPATGQLTFQQRIVNSAVAGTGNSISDVEWSANGEYLYVSRTGETGIPGDVIQYDLSNPANSPVSILPQPNTIFRSFGLQLAPDSAIYHLYQATNGGPILMGKITDTDSVAALVTYAAQAFPGNQTFNTTQFSSFAPSDTVNLTVAFTASGLCANAPTAFFPTVTPGADSLRWDFGDGNGSTEWSPVYTYTDGGSFNVSVTAFLNGQEATSAQPININAFDTQISLVQDTTACSCELPYPKVRPLPPGTVLGTPSCGTAFSVKATVNNGSGGTPQLQWYGPAGLIAGATSETLAPDSAGYYYLVATVGGCSTYAGVNIKEYDVQDQRANIWYFGQNAGLDFNPSDTHPVPVAISNPVMTAPEGTSTISDRNGQVVFFTDGRSLWNRQNTELALAGDPAGLGGDPTSAQSALIIPVAGDETLYYIFTTKEIFGTGTYEVRYSLFDVKLNGGTGGLIEQNVLLFAKSTERLTGSGDWLVAHEYGNNSFRSYQISNLGIGNPVISGVGSDHSITSAQNGQGYMVLGADNKLAVALSTPGTSNIVEVFDFDPATGLVSNPRTANLQTPNGQVYGVAFSPGGGKLFATLQDGGNSKIVEFAFDSLGIPRLKQPPLTTLAQTPGAIQMGPNGQLYVAIDGASALGTIQAIEDTTMASIYTPDAQPLAGGTTSTLGLPNFIQNLGDPVQGPSISIAGECLQDSVQFQGTPTDPIDKFFWQVRSGATVVTTSSEQEFAFLFTTPGLYDVSLQLTNRCGLDTVLTQQLRIFAAPPDPTRSAVICQNELVLDANPTDLPDLSYVWSTTDTTETITVNRRGIYRVTVTNANGCSVDGTILAAENRPVVDLGNDLTICQNTPLPALDAQNPGAVYAWTVSNSNGTISTATTRTQAVNTSSANVAPANVFEYQVIVTDPVTTCFVRDSVLYTINPLPVITPPVSPAIACGATTGAIDFSITGPAASLFSYSITGPSAPVSNSNVGPAPVAIPTATGLAAGNYAITVSEQVTGCFITSTASINNNSYTVAGLQDVTCDPININATITGTITPTYTYRILDNSAAAIDVKTGSGVNGTPAGATFSTVNATTGPQGLPSSNRLYIVEVRGSDGCIASSPPVTINQGPTVPTTLVDAPCANPVTITSTGGTAWTWTGGNSTIVPSSANMQTMQANILVGGSYTYNLRVTDGVNCPLDTAVTLSLEPGVISAISQSQACTDLVTVTATPNGNYLYRWFRDGTIDNNLGGTQVTAGITNDGQQYSVTLYSPVTGCTYPSAPLVVQVDGEFDVTLATTTPCEGSPFTITATTTNNRPATFQWDLAGSIITGQVASTLQDERAGDYTVTATAASCVATADINIILAPTTPGLLTDTKYICPDPANPDPNTRSVVLSPGEFDGYDWFKDGVSLGITTPTLDAGEPGLYSVNLLNSFACPSSDKTNVLLQCDPVVVGPNAFRPTSSVIGLGGDLVNQAFLLYTFFIDDEDFQVFIFNRWGEMIYQTNQRDFRWNGGYNNNGSQLAPAGTYTYVVRYKSSYRPEKGIQEKRGGVVLLK